MSNWHGYARTALLALGIAAAAAGQMAAGPQQGMLLHGPGERPSFEVTSVRPAPVTDGRGGRLDGSFLRNDDGVQWVGATVVSLLKYAYGIGHDELLSGGPKWMGSERFDISAKVDVATATVLAALSHDDRDEQMRLRTQTLLAERFGLKVSFGKREMPTWDLVVAQGGLKCTAATPGQVAVALGPSARYPASLPPPPPPPPPPGGAIAAPVERNRWPSNPQLSPRGWPEWLLVAILAVQPEVEGRVVQDKTGLSGAYDCDLAWTREGSEVPGPSFFTAVEKQVGLRFVSTRAEIETLVVENVERPTEN